MREATPTTVRGVLNDPTASYWLKKQVMEILSRDPVDVLNDLEVLREVAQFRLDEVIDKHKRWGAK